MAWARPPGAPKLPSCPIEALEPQETDYKSLPFMYGLPVGFTLIGLISPVVTNYYAKRPLYAGIWKCIVGALTMGFIGLKLRDFRNEVINDKDEVLRQYIALHPEDFPPYQRVLIKDTIEPWEPRR